jgi:hypothetical protein
MLPGTPSEKSTTWTRARATAGAAQRMISFGKPVSMFSQPGSILLLMTEAILPI